jgi:uncharacterized repeat protein (TIGR01451 family)
MAQDEPDPGTRPFRPFNGFFSDLGKQIMGQPADQPAPPPQYVPRQVYPPGDVSPRTKSVTAPPVRGPDVADVPDEPPANFAPQDGGSRLLSRPGTVLARPEAPAAQAAAPSAQTVAPPPQSIGPPPLADSPPARTDSSSPAAPSPTGDNFSFHYNESEPLYQRMQDTRRSAFGDPAASGSEKGSEPAADWATGRQAEAPPASGGGPQSPASTGLEPRLAPPRPAGDSAAGKPAIAAPGEPAAGRPSLLTPSGPAAGKSLVAAPGESPSAPKESDVLIARNGPVLSIETLGPRRIVVGKEAAYEVTVQNSGEVPADDVTVLVSLPEWAAVANAAATVGDTRPGTQEGNQPLRWSVGYLAARSREKLTLKIVPHQSKPFELSVRWDCKPSASQAMIEVQEPKLVMRLAGPHEVFFNKREVYKLTLSNSGNGPAENIALTLASLAGSESPPVSHRLGTLAAGEERTIDVELVARQAGNLTIRVEARGDGGAHAELAEKVVVHRPGLRIDMEGPATQFIGASASYKLHVRNPGDAAAKNIKVGLTLPTGVKYVSGSDGARLSAGGDKVQWNVEQLEPGGERVLLVRCTLALSGNSRLEAASVADDELTAAAESVTEVEALADLRLELKDPDCPVPVGQDAVYELRLHNRGTKTAENVEIMAYFSNNVEPAGAEGHPHRISPGQVIFSPIANVAPGAEVVLKVRARAQTAGNHIFRAEVHCKPLGMRLVREETTHFYTDGAVTEQAARPGEPAAAAPAGEPLRTADRWALPLPPPGAQPKPLAQPQPAVPPPLAAPPPPAVPPKPPAPPQPGVVPAKPL